MLKHEEIQEYIKEQINSGTWKPKAKLPSLRDMSELFSTSIGTVLTAYSALEKKHIIYSIPRSGYYVLGKDSLQMNSRPPAIDFYSGAPDSRYMPYDNFQHCVNTSLQLFREDIFTYSNSQGLPALITALQKQFRQYQVHAEPSNIIVTSGSQQALDILCRMPFPNGKQTILLEEPAYYGMVKSVYLCNSRVIGIRKDFDGIDFDELERLFLYGDIKFFYTIPRYHNPTGHSYSKQEKETLVRLARKYNVYIVEDDIAADFDTDSRNDPLYYYDISDKVIYVKSFSKILMPGLRVSALVLPPLLKNIFLEYKEWTDTYTSILSQGSLAVYLESGLFNKYQDSIRQLYINRMKILRETAEEHPYSNIRWNIPDSGFFACMKLNSEVPFQQLQPYLFKNKISLMDTSNFFLNEYKNYSYYRVSLSKANEKEIQTGIPVLLNILSGLQPR